MRKATGAASMLPSALLLLPLLLIRAAAAAAAGEDPCENAGSCGECIRLHPSCVWCIADDVKNSGCSHESSAKCTGERRVAPVSNEEILRNNMSDHEIAPQHIRLLLRVGETRVVHISYRKKEDYPLDLYYLMDLSSSMKEYKATLASLGKELADEMKKVTANFQLGFGSFVDKLALPFVDLASYNKSKYVTPYSFKHHLSLQTNPEKFSDSVMNAPISTNADTPEGGLDALMQAMVCDEIGWKRDARHLMILSTDAPYHIAGDGKLAGVVEPNDETCHLHNNEYTHSTVYDYPSIAQIKKKVKEKEIILLFAVTDHVKNIYERLSDRIPGSQVKILSNSNSNIPSIISDAYKQFDKKVELSDSMSSAGIIVAYEALCPGRTSYIKTKECKGVVTNLDIPFRINITVPACPSWFQETVWKETIRIQPVGTKDGVEIDLEVYCGCPCEKSGNKFYEKKSAVCSSQGSSICGLCRCDGDWIGENCNCKRTSNAGTWQDDCKRNETAKICNGRGSCVCGQCLCDTKNNPEEKFTGKYCECDNYSCSRSKGRVCSGSDRGRCECGTCVCLPGWSGVACQCLHNDNCIAPGHEKYCSGNGNCNCGKCVCVSGYSGKYCGDIAGQPGGRCTELKDCVECTVHKTGKYSANNCSACNHTEFALADSIREEELNPEERYCRLPHDSGCTFTFKYRDVDDKLSLVAERKMECPEPVNLIAVISGVAGSILAIGILTLVIWKIVTSIHDKREYERYEQSVASTKWAELENPLHQPSTTTVHNPTFRQNSRRSK